MLLTFFVKYCIALVKKVINIIVVKYIKYSLSTQRWYVPALRNALINLVTSLQYNELLLLLYQLSDNNCRGNEPSTVMIGISRHVYV